MPRQTHVGKRFDIVFVGDAAVGPLPPLADDAVRSRTGRTRRRLVLPFGAKVACEVTTTVRRRRQLRQRGGGLRPARPADGAGRLRG